MEKVQKYIQAGLQNHSSTRTCGSLNYIKLGSSVFLAQRLPSHNGTICNDGREHGLYVQGTVFSQRSYFILYRVFEALVVFLVSRIQDHIHAIWPQKDTLILMANTRSSIFFGFIPNPYLCSPHAHVFTHNGWSSSYPPHSSCSWYFIYHY